MIRPGATHKRVMLIYPELQEMLGLEHGMVLRQIDFWQLGNEESDNKTYFRDGRWWVRKSIPMWQSYMGRNWSKDKIKRLLQELEDLGLLISSSTYNYDPEDRTKWYSADLEALDRMEALWVEMGIPACTQRNPAYEAFLAEWELRDAPSDPIAQSQDPIAESQDPIVQSHPPNSGDSTHVLIGTKEGTQNTKSATPQAARHGGGKSQFSDDGKAFDINFEAEEKDRRSELEKAIAQLAKSGELSKNMSRKLREPVFDRRVSPAKLYDSPDQSYQDSRAFRAWVTWRLTRLKDAAKGKLSWSTAVEVVYDYTKDGIGYLAWYAANKDAYDDTNWSTDDVWGGIDFGGTGRED